MHVAGRLVSVSCPVLVWKQKLALLVCSSGASVRVPHVNSVPRRRAEASELFTLSTSEQVKTAEVQLLPQVFVEPHTSKQRLYDEQPALFFTSRKMINLANISFF